MNKKLLAGILAIGFVLTSCGKSDKETKDTKIEESNENKEAKEETKDNKESENKDEISNSQINIPNTNVTLKAASYKFESHVGGSPYELTEVSFDMENKDPFYNFAGKKDGKDYSLRVNANTAETSDSKKDLNKDAKDILNLGKAIPPEEAMRIALKDNNGGKIKTWTLLNDGKLTKYEIELEDGNKVFVNAISKDLIK